MTIAEFWNHVNALHMTNEEIRSTTVLAHERGVIPFYVFMQVMDTLGHKITNYDLAE